MSEVLTQEKIVRLLAEKISGTKKLYKAKLFFDAIISELSENLINNKSIQITGFGNFKIVEKSSRPGRNPKTGEYHEIAARKKVIFVPGPKLKTIISEKI